MGYYQPTLLSGQGRNRMRKISSSILRIFLAQILCISCGVRPGRVIKTGPPSEWKALLDHVSDEVEIQLENGHKAAGIMTSVTDSDVALNGSRFSKEQVARVYLKVRDPINDGMLIGLIAGGTAGFLAPYLRHRDSSPAPRVTDVGAAWLGAVAGLVIGGLVDRAHNPGRELIYQKR